MKIAIFGGSFSPVTKGHTRLANYIAANGIVDIVYMMPCYRSLYNKGLESGEDRLQMIKLSDRHQNVLPFDWEIKNEINGEGTYEIMKKLESTFPGNDLYFIMGLDNSQKVRQWKNGHKILDESKFIVVPRLGTKPTDVWFMDPPHIFLNEYVPDNISSTSVKELLRDKGNLDEHLDKTVKEYIIRKSLYGG